VYTPRAVEIETTLNKTGVAYVGGHVKEAGSREAIEAFKNILQTHEASTVADKEDMEAVLVIWSQGCSLDEMANLFEYITKAGTEDSINFLTSGTAAVSYRATGISPTQRESSFSNSWYGMRNTLVSVIALSVLLGVQILGMQYGGTPRPTVYMGLVGYLAIVILTFLLLLMVKGEIYAEKQKLGPCFDNALWSFSNASHTEHRRMERPSANTLITARPLEASPTRRLWRKVVTTVLTTSTVGAFVLYYISMRVSPWWVSLSGVGVIWIAALYRSLFSPTTIVASQDIAESDEYWIGMFSRTLSDSLLSTIEAAHHRQSKVSELALPAIPPQSPSSVPDEYVLVEAEKQAVNQPAVDPKSNVFLFIHQPGRVSLNSWSGAEDVIKVGIEVAKLACRTRTNSFPSCELHWNVNWLRLVRMKLAIYVPGLIWRSNHYLDMPLPDSFKLADVIRHILKIVHVCMVQPGTISRHTVNEEEAIELSHVLCGPVADPPVHKDFSKPTSTLRELLAAIRDNERNTDTRKFSVEQTLLLPTIMLATAYDRWKPTGSAGTGGYGHEIDVLQDLHLDKLMLSGIKWLPTLQRALDKFNLLDDFMVETDPEMSDETITARDESSGCYELTNRVRGWEENFESPEKND
jgi:hypothetical protein